MASKAKGFKQLLSEKRASNTKHKLAQKVMQKIKSGEYGDIDAEVVIEPKGHEKMSDVLIKFIKPYLDTVKNRNDYEMLVMLGTVAWNTSIIPVDKQEKAMSMLLSDIFTQAPIHVKDSVLEIIDELKVRKEKYFKQIKRLIIDYKIEEIGDDFHLSVVSSFMEN